MNWFAVTCMVFMVCVSVEVITKEIVKYKQSKLRQGGRDDEKNI